MTRPSIGSGRPWRVRILLIALFCLATSLAGHAGVKDRETLTASKVFAEAPLEALDMIRPSTRLDMLDYYEQADSILTAANALGGETRLVAVAPDYLKVAVTPVSTLEIKVLPIGKKQVVMTLYTVGDADIARDTDVRFFDEQLRPLDSRKFLKAPSLKDFFPLKGSELTEAGLAEKVPFASILYETGPGSEPLKASLTTLRAISQEDRDLLAPLLIPSLSAPWKGKYTFK